VTTLTIEQAQQPDWLCRVWTDESQPCVVTTGRHYRYGSDRIDFAHLGEWCRARQGQVIACEAQGATWLPFQPLASTKTTRKGRRSAEAVWTTENAA